jgi:hypothetical protein
MACAQPYQPSLAAAWLFQRSMALKIGQLRAARGRRGAVSGFLPASHVNRLLRANFRVMQVRRHSPHGSWLLDYALDLLHVK